MTPRTTRCPQCGTRFRVGSEQLETAGGWVRCGRCAAVFHADHPNTIPPILHDALDVPSTAPVQERPAEGADAQAETDLFKPPRRTGGTVLRLATLLLALALLAQIVWFDRERLLQDPVIGARVAAWCQQLGCELGPVRAPDQLVLESHRVGPHPETGEALRVSAVLRNTAPFPQPCPRLELSFLDTQGSVVARRRFAPGEYLVTPPSPCVLAPGARAEIRLDLADPGIAPLAYRFDFL